MSTSIRRPAVSGVVISAIALSIVGGTSTALAAGSKASGASKSLTVGFVVDPSWAQIPVAAADGYFRSAGLTVKVIDFSTGVQALQALAAGQVDITTAADVPVSATLVSAKNIDIIADGSRWTGSVIVGSTKEGVTSSSSLAGKNVGTPLGTSAAYFASSFLKQAGVSANLVIVAP